MNITFLIGNGFDMKNGLKTRFSDFIKIYCKIEDRRPAIQKFKDVINSNILQWSDFEKMIGEYTASFSSEAAFFTCLSDFSNEFIKYLKKEEERIPYECLSDTVLSEFIASTYGIEGKLGTPEGEIFVGNAKKMYGDSKTVYNFLVFNYTHIIDELITISKKETDFIGTHVSGNTQYYDVWGDVIHVHGTTNHSPIIGVNDVTQIANQNFASSSKFSNKLVKPIFNEKFAGYDNNNRAKNQIASSHLICVFGMSLGETDSIWWQTLGKWLKENSTHKLIISLFDPKWSPWDSFGTASIKYNIFDIFVARAGLTEDVAKKIESQIFVSINPPLFSLWLFDSAKNEKEAITV